MNVNLKFWFWHFAALGEWLVYVMCKSVVGFNLKLLMIAVGDIGTLLIKRNNNKGSTNDHSGTVPCTSIWRRRGDSNPRWDVIPNTLSRRAT